MPHGENQLMRHLTIFGRVQGVGFRWALSAQPRALGLGGWVRNRRNGSVEALVSGPPDAVEALSEWARHGPPGAQVEGVMSNDPDGDAQGEPGSGFSQRATL